MSAEEQPPRADRDRLLADVADAVEAVGRSGAASPDAAPGDLYAFAATAEHDVEWLLAAADADGHDRFRAVAADTGPWIGGADVELTTPAGTGPLVARCRHWLWLSGADLRAGARTGHVPAGSAAAVEERCRQVEEDRLDPSPLERETDEDPDYRDRDEELAAARRALADARSHGGSPRAAGDDGDEAAFPPLRAGGARWAWAAAALLAVALGLLAGHTLEQRQRLGELEGRLERLRAPVAVPLGGDLFRVGVTVRDPQLLRPTEVAGSLYLQLAFFTAGDGPFEAEIRAAGGGEPLVRFAGLGPPMAMLVWPADLLAPGRYELLVYDAAEQPRRLVDDALLRVGGSVSSNAG